MRSKDSQTTENYIKLTFIALIFIVAGYLTYTSFYPTDKFYLDEFERASLRKAPASAEVISKSSSFPSIHGEYFSTSIIKLTQEDYNNLITDMEKDDRYTINESLVYSDNYGSISKIGAIEKFFVLKVSSYQEDLFTIRFLSDKQTIIVHISES